MTLTVYHHFWNALLKEPVVLNAPTLITFNYDLVLERTLWQFFHYDDRAEFRPYVNSVGMKYCFGNHDFSFHGVAGRFLDMPTGPHPDKIVNGFMPTLKRDKKTDVDIPYLKLHGSLNWSQNNDPKGLPPNLPTEVVKTPLILPPVFNKMNTGQVNVIWARALELLRKAKHIIIVGYSLPKTDIYMQYFLKSAVGPNSDLQRIIVFNPVLFDNAPEAVLMKERYKECFSPQFTSRITFEPEFGFLSGGTLKGSFSHFVQALQRQPSQGVLFYP